MDEVAHVGKARVVGLAEAAPPAHLDRQRAQCDGRCRGLLTEVGMNRVLAAELGSQFTPDDLQGTKLLPMQLDTVQKVVAQLLSEAAQELGNGDFLRLSPVTRPAGSFQPMLFFQLSGGLLQELHLVSAVVERRAKAAHGVGKGSKLSVDHVGERQVAIEDAALLSVRNAPQLRVGLPSFALSLEDEYRTL